MTVKLVWLGEDDLHRVVSHDGVTTQGAGPSHCVWNSIKFEKDKPVTVTDPDMIRRAKGNRFFKVYDDTPASKAGNEVSEANAGYAGSSSMNKANNNGPNKS